MEESTKEGKIYSDYLDNWSVGIPSKNFSSLSVLNTYKTNERKQKEKKNFCLYNTCIMSKALQWI